MSPIAFVSSHSILRVWILLCRYLESYWFMYSQSKVLYFFPQRRKYSGIHRKEPIRIKMMCHSLKKEEKKPTVKKKQVVRIKVSQKVSFCHFPFVKQKLMMWNEPKWSSVFNKLAAFRLLKGGGEKQQAIRKKKKEKCRNSWKEFAGHHRQRWIVASAGKWHPVLWILTSHASSKLGSCLNYFFLFSPVSEEELKVWKQLD